jgi:hypothetical protein
VSRQAAASRPSQSGRSRSGLPVGYGEVDQLLQCGDVAVERFPAPWAEPFLPPNTEVHAAADRPLMAEFLRFVREGGRTETSPVGARMSVAAGVQAPPRCGRRGNRGTSRLWTRSSLPTSSGASGDRRSP